MSHEADSWIAKMWMGKEVRQISGSPACIGEEGIVVGTMWDEKGALHCKMVNSNNEEWCCSAAMLDFSPKATEVTV